LNLIGGDLITITGLSFPRNLSNSNVDIKFNDAQKTSCVAEESSPSKIVCRTSSFNKIPSSSLKMSIDINGAIVDPNTTLSSKTEVKGTLSMNPSSVSQVLKTNISIKLDSTFPHTLKKEEFEVNATNKTNSTYIRFLNVVAVDDTTKTITALFGGAWSGKYSIQVRHSLFGLVDTSTLELDVSTHVDSISPSKGSIYGGTLMTVKGRNFGKVATDNPIIISTNGGVNAKLCVHTFTSPTEIKCRIETLTDKKDKENADLVLFAKLSEEAKCKSPICNFTYTSDLPTIASFSSSFDQSQGAYIVTASGSKFPSQASDFELIIDGKI
jgi:hypothetical protein